MIESEILKEGEIIRSGDQKVFSSTKSLPEIPDEQMKQLLDSAQYLRYKAATDQAQFVKNYQEIARKLQTDKFCID